MRKDSTGAEGSRQTPSLAGEALRERTASETAEDVWSDY